MTLLINVRSIDGAIHWSVASLLMTSVTDRRFVYWWRHLFISGFLPTRRIDRRFAYWWRQLSIGGLFILMTSIPDWRSVYWWRYWSAVYWWQLLIGGLFIDDVSYRSAVIDRSPPAGVVPWHAVPGRVCGSALGSVCDSAEVTGPGGAGGGARCFPTDRSIDRSSITHNSSALIGHWLFITNHHWSIITSIIDYSQFIHFFIIHN